MAKKYTTKISLKNRKRNKKSGFKLFGDNTTKTGSRGKSRSGSKSSSTGSRFAKFGNDKKKKNYGSWSTWNNSKGKKRASATTKIKPLKGFTSAIKSRKAAKVFYTITAVFIIMTFVGTISALAYMQNLTKDLPDPEAPFENEKFQVETSIMYDRNGKELYRLFDDDNRDIIRIEDDQEFDEVIPPQLKWSFLAAEDMDFYSHPGFDVNGIASCSWRYLRTGVASCGGSTITQQVVKIAALEDNTRTIERKLNELVLAVQLERTVDDKDKILLLYMNIAPQGGNRYGAKTAAEFYFSKDLDELTLKESAIIASIPNDPSLLAPVGSYNPELGQERLNTRVNFIFDEMLESKDRINEEVLESRERLAEKEGRELTDEEKEPFITEEKIEAARAEEPEYNIQDDNIIAPHFVIFAQNLLTQREYNDGDIFTEQQIKTGGYKIYTTLDLDLQNVALDVVQNKAIGEYGSRYGGNNAALMTMIPETGEIVTMVGSKCFNNRELSNCTELDESQGELFDREVNILTSQQQPGSSIKPLVYSIAFDQGLLATGSQMADVPIEIGNYKPKNSDGGFVGINTTRYMIGQSRNIPAVAALVAVGPEKLAELKADLGYTVNVDPATYGPSAALGSQDVKAVEHANAYAAYANGGEYVPHEVVLRIEDKDGNVVFDLEEKDKPEATRVVDETVAFLVNDSTNPQSATGAGGTSPVKWRGRDMSGKTGTSENNRDTWFVNYSPDFVTVGWLGNNDNTRMARGAFGSTSVEPWVRDYMQRIGDSEYFSAKTPYERPGGIGRGEICNTIEVNGEEKRACESTSDYFIQDRLPPVYVTKQTAEVCVDQPDRLAREIDIRTGNAEEREFNFVRMIADSLQDDLDKYLKEKQGGNGIPKEECDVNRSPNGEAPWAEINSPAEGSSHSGSINVSVNGFSPNGNVTRMEFFLGGTSIGSTSNNSFSGNLAIPDGTLSGNYTFRVVVTDNTEEIGESSVRINISGVSSGLSVDSPSNGSTKPIGPINVQVSHDGSLSDVRLFVQKAGGEVIDLGVMSGSGGNLSATWTPTEAGVYSIWAKSVGSGFESETSNVVSVTVE